MSRLAVIPTLAALLLLGAGCAAAPSSAPKPATPTINISAAENTPGEREAVIKMTANGFEPSQISVSVGTAVQFKNTDTINHWPASAVHPTHQELPGFDALREITPGESYVYTFTKVGTWKFHNHLNPTQVGSIIVTE